MGKTINATPVRKHFYRYNKTYEEWEEYYFPTDASLVAETNTRKIMTSDERNKLGYITLDNSHNVTNLPKAASDVLGAIKVGTGFNINSSTGVLSLKTAASDTLGGIKVGTGLSINSDTGVLSVASGTVPSGSDSGPQNVSATAGLAGTATTWSRSDHVHKILLDTGDSNGQIKIAGTNVSVKGLGSLAYKSSLSASDIPSLAYVPTTEKGTASGVATLDSGGKIPTSQIPDVVMGQLMYGGTVEIDKDLGGTEVSLGTEYGTSDSNNVTGHRELHSLTVNLTSTNVTSNAIRIYLTSNAATLLGVSRDITNGNSLASILYNKKLDGMYFLMSNAYNASGNLDTVYNATLKYKKLSDANDTTSDTVYDVTTGDWLIFSTSETSNVVTTEIKKIDNTDTVRSVNGKIGAVTLTYSDVSAAPTKHDSTGTSYGVGTISNYGHVKIDNSTLNASSASTDGVAAGLGHKHSQYLTAQSVSSNNNTASWGSAVVVGTVGGTDLKFTMPTNPNTNTWRPVKVGSTTLSDASTTLTLAGAGNIDLAFSSGTVTITGKGGTYLSEPSTPQDGDLWFATYS